MEVRVVFSSDRYDSLREESALNVRRRQAERQNVLFTLGGQVATKPGIGVSIANREENWVLTPWR